MAESKSDLVTRLIVRYIRDADMKRGDRLPSQDFFRTRFKCGMTTVTSAINSLKNNGVLDVRDKVGVYVVDPNADGHAGRVIGITARNVEGSPYYSCLLGALQMSLIREGCHVKIFCYNGKVKAENKFDFNIEDFPGLKRNIEDKEIHGLIHLDDLKPGALNFLAKHKIPTLFVGSVGCSPNGIFYDQAQTLRDICARAEVKQASRIMLCVPGGIRQYLEELFGELTGGRGTIRSVYYQSDGVACANEIIAMPEAERPEIVLYFDDIVALAVTNTLALNLPIPQLPKGIFIISKQLMLLYPVPNPVFYAIDLVEMARMASECLLEAMKSGTIEMNRRFYRIIESRA